MIDLASLRSSVFWQPEKRILFLELIKRNISFKSKDVRLCKALVRPRLEFCVQAWCPYFRKDIAMIETVQRRATKLIEGLRDMSYSERLSYTGLISMEKRRVRGDLIQVFKMLKSKDVIVILYKALVRSRLLFCVQARCAYLRKDIAMIETVQRRATKLIEGFRDRSYLSIYLILD